MAVHGTHAFGMQAAAAEMALWRLAHPRQKMVLWRVVHQLEPATVKCARRGRHAVGEGVAVAAHRECRRC